MKYNDIARKGIEKFDLEEFFLRSAKYDDDYGASLLITPKQTLFALNGDEKGPGSGRGVHDTTLSVLISEIYGIELENLAPSQTFRCHHFKQMINARLVNDTTMCGMYFTLRDLDKISINEYNQFVEFYDKYNERIKKLSEQLNTELVGYTFGDISGNSDDLEPLLALLKEHIDMNKEDVPEQIIDVTEEDKKACLKETIVDEYKVLLEKYNEFVKKNIIECDYTTFLDAIKKIEEQILNKAEDSFTFDEKREIMIKMSIVIDNLNKYIHNSNDIIATVKIYRDIDKIRESGNEEKYNIELERFLDDNKGSDNVKSNLELVKNSRRISEAVKDDLIEFATKKIVELGSGPNLPK